jgi:hypothetical protein
MHYAKFYDLTWTRTTRTPDRKSIVRMVSKHLGNLGIQEDKKITKENEEEKEEEEEEEEEEERNKKRRERNLNKLFSTQKT